MNKDLHAEYFNMPPDEFLQSVGFIHKAKGSDHQDTKLTDSGTYVVSNENKNAGMLFPPMKGFIERDDNYNYGTHGVKERYNNISYYVLREIERKNPIVSTIINTRCRQVRQFARPSLDVDMPGFQILLRDIEKKADKQQKERIDSITDWFYNTGRTDFPDWEMREDMFGDVITKITREFLTIDKVTIEIRKDRNDKPVDFWVLDGGTIKRVIWGGFMGDKSDFDPRNFVVADNEFQQKLGEDRVALLPDDMTRVAYVQQIDGRYVAAFTRADLLMDNMQKRADVRYNGQGYCLPGDVKVLTDNGYVKMEHIINSKKEYKIWNGENFSQYQKIISGDKELVITTFQDGSILKSSPQHKFKTVNEAGELEFREQRELQVGDWVVCEDRNLGRERSNEINFSHKWTTFHKDLTGEFEVKTITPQIAELLGWLTGDGTFDKNSFGCDRVRLYYYLSKNGDNDDSEALFSHKILLDSLGIKYGEYLNNTDTYGVQLFISNKGFGLFLQELGFSRKHKIPDKIHNLTDDAIIAFLRGLFSADGHVHKASNIPILSTVDKDLAMGTQLLLRQIGIRSIVGKKKITGRLQDLFYVHVFDIEEYRDKIGFIQSYKMDILVNYKHKAKHWKKNDMVPYSYIYKILNDDEIIYDKRQLRKMKKGYVKTNSSRKWLLESGVNIEHTFKRIKSITKTNKKVKMYDISIKNGPKQFVAEGVYVHNSNTEQAISVVTAFLYGLAYNAEQFNSGTVPKIGIAFKDANFSEEQMQSMQDQWIANHRGPKGRWRLPIFNREVNVLDFLKSSQDMEYMKYMEFVGSLIASIFGFDLAEAGLRYGQAQNVLNENVDAKQKFSKDRGLKDMLSSIETIMNKIMRINGWSNEFVFKFTGLDPEDKEANSKIMNERVKRDTTVNELRAEQDKEPIPGGDVILDPTYMQGLQMQAMESGEGGGGDYEEDMVGGEAPEDEDNPSSGDSELDEFVESEVEDLGKAISPESQKNIRTLLK